MPNIVSFGTFWLLVKKAVTGFFADNAAMAFYAATSLAPVLLIVIAIAGFAAGRDVAQVAVAAQLAGLLGPQGADLLESIVVGASNTSSGLVAGSFALITLLVSASGVFGEMQTSLNQIWKVPPVATGLSTLVRARAASLGLVAALGFLLLVSLVVSAAISGLAEVINRNLPFGSWLLSFINTVVSVSLIALLFGAVYKVLPDRSLSWRDVRFGAVVTAILFTSGKSLIGWYLGTSAIASSYGLPVV
jgi:membrane protein